MTAAVLVRELERDGVDLFVEGHTLRFKAPRGALSREVKERLSEHKEEIVQVLATSAVVEFRRLYRQVAELGELADAADAAGDVALAAGLEAEAFELIDGAAGDALMRMLAFPAELVELAEASIDLVGKEPQTRTQNAEPRTTPSEFMPVPLSPIRNQPEPTRVCYQCGQRAWRKNPSELWICGVCYPDPDTCAQLPVGIPAGGSGRLQLRILEEGSR